MDKSALIMKKGLPQQIKCINWYCESGNNDLTEAIETVCDYYDVEYLRNKKV